MIYTSIEDYTMEYMNQRLTEEFPDYDITIEYIASGDHAAKLLAEGTETACDITDDLEYASLLQLDEAGILADVAGFKKYEYTEDAICSDNFLPLARSGGAIIINPDLLEEKGLPEPASYEDLLDPQYQGLISMPNPKASSTGYMFLKSLVNAWGEDEAFAYFDALSPNILQYTSSGSGPLNAVLQGEAVIGLGMTSSTVTKINEGHNLKIIFFEEGSPYALYGQAIIKGKEERKAVREVFDFMVNVYDSEVCEMYYPEKVLKDKDYKVENYPQNIQYADMSNNTVEEKEHLLEKWKY